MINYTASRVEGQTRPDTTLSYEAKRLILMNDIAMCIPYKKMVETYSELWGVSETTIHRFIECVKADMEKGTTAKSIKELNTHRTNDIINKLIDDGEYEKAVKAIDTQNKTVGLYKDEKPKETEPKDVNLSIKFNF